MKKIEVLISTMNLKNEEEYSRLIEKMNVKDSLTINQITKENIKLFDSANIISLREKGLSKSRNKAILNSNAEICILADDDLEYVNNYDKLVLDAYEKYPDADIIAFDIESDNEERKIKSLNEGKVKIINTMRIHSVQMTFKRKSIIEKKIQFDEDFGAGSGKYNSGEENIFLIDCIKKGLKIYYCKKTLAKLNIGESSWFTGFNEKFLIDKGAMFQRMSKALSLPLIYQFAIRKYKLYKNNYSFFKGISLLKKGKYEYSGYILSKNEKIKIFMVGDFYSNTGPAIVNKNFRKSLKSNALYSLRKTKFGRIIEFSVKVLFCDAVCFCSFSKLNIFGIKLSKFLGKLTFYIMHGYIKEESKINNEKNNAKVQMEQYILNNVDSVFCVSKKLCDYMKNFKYNTNFDYIYNGIDWNNITLDEKKKKMQIMSTGSDIPRKKNMVICRAIELLNSQRNEKIKYVLLGKNNGHIDDFLKYDFVEYDEVNYDECLQKMSESILYIQNSEFETFGLAVVEALANGCNLLISNNVGASGIMTLNDDDIIFNNNDEQEIAKKIENVLKHNNNKRILESIDKDKTSIESRSKELVEKISDLVIKSRKGV